MKNIPYSDYGFLIIGNGFDLACDYKTSFKDYLKYIIEKEPDPYSLDLITFIHYIYYKNKEEINHRIELSLNINNWYDIENNILNLVNRNIINEAIDFINRINDDSSGVDLDILLDEETFMDYTASYDTSKRDFHICKYIYEKYNDNYTFSAYLNEINEFEKAFKKYLIDIAINVDKKEEKEETAKKYFLSLQKI